MGEISENAGDGEGKWLEAFYDPMANLYTFTQCMTFSDIHADGDMKLVVAHLGTGAQDMKLKVFKGTNLITENTLIDLPTGVVSFYLDTNQPRTPAIAVASGPNIFVYKNMRPFFKFTVPALDVNPVEEDLWRQAREEKIDIGVLHEMLEELRQQGAELTSRSLKFLTLDPRELESFAQVHKYGSLKRLTVITCIDTLQKSMTDEDAIRCLVIGTENRHIIILDPEAFTVLAELQVPDVPVFLSVNGLFDVEYRIIFSCRNGCIYTLKRGMKSVEKGIEVNSHPVAMSRIGKNIVVGCMDNTLRSYSTKGKKLWSIQLPADITAVGVMDHKQRGFKAAVVGLSNKTVCIYKEKFLVNKISTPDVVSSILFGKFGREDGTLVLVMKGGGLLVKILKRTATFDEKDILAAGPPAGQALKLDVPKKTKLFVDQTIRERENGTVMHRQFMHELQRLRLNSAKAYAESLMKGDNPISNSVMEPLKLNALINGIGPTFRLKVNLQNTSENETVIGMIITFSYDGSLYNVHRKLITCPMLVPGVVYTFETLVDCISDKGIADVVKVFVVKSGNSVPLISANISMPVSEIAIQ
ncbi:Bardet-Biedl syndrome 1 protein-like [Watersipora subatra]|uniref:Bardet-Biedl syndrome 1 protein-like n=1 Tax=Watersipora subatra TaxID=2589382 RepID=UPI00355BE38A